MGENFCMCLSWYVVCVVLIRNEFVYRFVDISISDYGECEPESIATALPKTISTSSFRETIANEWKHCAEYIMVSLYT